MWFLTSDSYYYNYYSYSLGGKSIDFVVEDIGVGCSKLEALLS
jgi:hypothetical protein